MTRLGWASLAASVAGAILVVIGLTLGSPLHTAYAWLVAVVSAYTIACGALLVSMTGYATDAAWIAVVRRPLEAIAGTLPLVAVLFVPILVSIELVYPWADGSTAGHAGELLRRKQAWLNEPAFVARSVVYLLAPAALGELFRAWSLRGRSRAPRVASTIAIPLFGLVITFAMFDWLMTLEPSFYSTSFGLIPNAGGFTAALGLLAVIIAVAHRRGALLPITSEHTHAIGKLVLTGVCVWAYLAFTHYLLIWIADLPDEARWYLPRTRGWAPVAIALIVLHFALPFAALLSRRLKRSPALLGLVGASLVAVHWLDLWWQAMPAIEPSAPVFGVADLGAVLAIGGAMALVAILRARRAPSIPRADPLLPRGLGYRSE